MYFLFRLDLSLHAGVGKKIGILIFGTKHGEGKGEGKKLKQHAYSELRP